MREPTAAARRASRSIAGVAAQLRHARLFLSRPGLAVALIVSVATSSACILLLGRSVRAWVDGGDAALGHAALAWSAAAGIGLAVSSAARVYTATVIGEDVAGRIRTTAFANLVHRPLAFFEESSSGALLSLILADAGIIQTVVRSALSPLIRNLVVVVGSVAMMAATSLSLTLACMVALSAPVIAVVSMSRRQKALSRSVQDQMAAVAGRAGEVFASMLTVKTLTREAQEIARFERAVAGTLGIGRRLAARRAVSLFLAICLGLALVGWIVWTGRGAVADGQMTVGQLSSFLFFMVLAAGASASMSDQWSSVLEASTAFERLAPHLQPQPSAANPEGATRAGSGAASMAFEAVDFRYPARPDLAALSDVSFRAEPGEFIAIVGPSGAGKTTLTRLLLGFERPAAGRILIDGHDVSGLDPAELRRRIAFVPQAPFLYSASIAENIRYGRPEASDEDVRAAAAEAAVDAFTAQLPDGIDSLVGEQGARLSGGQRQRIAIARALLRDAGVLLLDEPTSALDALTETVVQRAFRRPERRTTIVIAHKLATVRAADRIVVLNHGRVEATGLHEELMHSSPLYRHLAELQLDSAEAEGERAQGGAEALEPDQAT